MSEPAAAIHAGPSKTWSSETLLAGARAVGLQAVKTELDPEEEEKLQKELEAIVKPNIYIYIFHIWFIFFNLFNYISAILYIKVKVNTCIHPKHPHVSMRRCRNWRGRKRCCTLPT